MITSADFVIYRVQAVVFTEPYTVDSAVVLRYAYEKWAALFDGAPLSLPIPQDAPPEIPRVVLKSKDSTWEFQISGNRAEVISNQPRLAEARPLAEGLRMAAEILCGYLAASTVKPNRLACVIKRQAPIQDPDPARVLASHFCQERWLGPNGPLNRPEHFQIHSHKVFSLARMDGISINSWFRCLNETSSDTSAPVVIAEQDLNTLAGATQMFELDKVMEFFRVLPEEYDRVLDRYFPKGGQDALHH